MTNPPRSPRSLGSSPRGGLFVSFEGIDRSGKTTQARLLVEALGEEAIGLREPGGTATGERLRELVKDPALELGPRAETLLFAAARAELVEQVIRPALALDRVVVCDRFVDSSLAYQGAARGLGLEAVGSVNRWATDDLRPDLTVLLVVDPGAAAARAGESDRFEAEGLDLQRRVLDAYEQLSSDEPARWRRIAADRPVEAVHSEVLEAVMALRGVPA